MGNSNWERVLAQQRAASRMTRLPQVWPPTRAHTQSRLHFNPFSLSPPLPPPFPFPFPQWGREDVTDAFGWSGQLEPYPRA